MIDYFLSIRRRHKQWLMLIGDSVLVMMALWAAYSLRYGRLYEIQGNEVWLWLLAPIIAVPSFLHFGLYQTMIRYIGFASLWKVFQAISLYALVWGVSVYLSGIETVPRSVIVINWLSCLLLVGGARMMARWLLTTSSPGLPGAASEATQNGLIYGAGEAGMQLAMATSFNQEIRPVAFLDDQASLIGQRVNGLRVYPPSEIKRLIDEFDVKEILLAIPSVTQQRRHEILSALEPYPVVVKTLPDISELEECKVNLDDVREIRITDLLERDAVAPIEALLHANISGKSVMVTGAGGSIGAELARQISQLGPSQLILLDHSEFNLYQLDRTLDHQGCRAQICLGSVLDMNYVSHLLRKYRVQTIYHAAAYKHVPIVEKNAIMGAINNVIGAKHCARAAVECGVETFVLISTDKAVRPVNIMGATKRLSELYLRKLSQKEGMATRFTMVRFGNVLDSSGSVVPLFREQIQIGGPVTVTHPDIIRYFMTIKEATQLVLQAGAMGEGGEVFVLDMGEPVSIDDLAKKMIRLSGLDIRSEANPQGDIEVEYLGLREGEKLFEELLVSEASVPTSHPRILKECEGTVNLDQLEAYLNTLQERIAVNDEDQIRSLLFEIVETYNPVS